MKGLLIQYGCSFFLSIMCGMNSFVSVWPSYAIQMLQREDSPLGFPVSSNAANLIGSLPMLGSLVSTIMAGYLAENLGRKRTLLACGVLFSVAWSLIVTATSTIQILIARFIIGLSMGASSVVCLIYNSEITHLNVRGSTTTLASLLYNVGIMISYLEGWFFSYDVICYISLTSTVAYVVLLSFLKETPVYLLKIGQEKEALKSLMFYRGASSETSEEIVEEFTYIKTQGQIKNTDIEPGTLSEKEKLQYDEQNENQTATEKKNGWVLLVTVPHYRRAIISSIIFTMLSCSMGMVAVQTYASRFFTEAAPTLSPDLCSVIFSLVLVLSNVLTVVVTDLFPRRTLMITNCALVTLCLATMGVAMHWPWVPSWVNIAAVLVFCLVYHLGVITIVFVQLSEAYGPRVNSEAAVTVFCAMYLANFFILYLFIPAVDYIGIDGTFFVFTAISAFTTVLSYFWIMETRRVPLPQIEKMYEQGIMYRKASNIES